MKKQMIHTGFLLVVLFNIFISLTQCSDSFLHTSIHRQREHKTVLLTGAAGFIGSNFLQYMFDKYPNYTFDVLDLLTYAGSLENIPDYIRKSNRFNFFYGSVTNPDIVDLVMSRADYVVHFAAESHVCRSIFDDLAFFDTDVMGTRVMMRSLVKHASTIQRYIHISTSEVCGTAETQPMDEEHPINPRSPYAAAKAGADRLVYSYWCTYDIPALIIRPFNNYGPQQHLEKMLPRFITAAMKGEPLTIHGTGEQSRDWLHTLDLARALDKALHVEDFSKIKNQIIHIGNGIATSIVTMAKKVLEYFDLSEDYLQFTPDRPGQVACHISSTEKAKKLLGWQTEISLEEGIKDVITWYENNRARWQRMEGMKHIPVQTSHGTITLQ